MRSSGDRLTRLGTMGTSMVSTCSDIILLTVRCTISVHILFANFDIVSLHSQARFQSKKGAPEDLTQRRIEEKK